MFNIRMPGRHNVLNALAAVAVGMELDMPFSAIAEGFQDEEGVDLLLDIPLSPDQLQQVSGLCQAMPGHP